MNPTSVVSQQHPAVGAKSRHAHACGHSHTYGTPGENQGCLLFPWQGGRKRTTGGKTTTSMQAVIKSSHEKHVRLNPPNPLKESARRNNPKSCTRSCETNCQTAANRPRKICQGTRMKPRFPISQIWIAGKQSNLLPPSSQVSPKRTGRIGYKFERA